MKDVVLIYSTILAITNLTKKFHYKISFSDA